MKRPAINFKKSKQTTILHMLTLEFVIWFMYFITIYFATFMFLTFLEYGVKDPKKTPLRKYPTVTVTIPAYNEEKSILETLKTVLALDYPYDKLKVLVVNDASTDETKNLVQTFLAKYKGKISIRLITHTKNKGKGAEKLRPSRTANIKRRKY